jgi:peptidoglycan hydrolase-like protein with peptidoglycan-binding domain
VLAVAAVGLVALGLVCGMLIAPAPAPRSLAANDGPRSLPVSTEQFDDVRSIRVTPVLTPEISLDVADSGRVTRSSCAVGSPIDSGSAPFTIDNRPVIALATSMPLWRDLSLRASGDDVLALQTELARLGYAVTLDAKFGKSTAAAVAAIQKLAGAAEPLGSLQAQSVMWLPSPQVLVGSCDVALGDRVSAATLVTVAGSLAELKVTDDLQGAALGARALEYNGIEAMIDDDGRVLDPAFLLAIAASAELDFALSDQGSGDLALDSHLVEPVEVVIVPPASLFELEADGAACIIADGKPRSVRVVSSALGTTMITFAGGYEPSEILLDAELSGMSCR